MIQRRQFLFQSVLLASAAYAQRVEARTGGQRNVNYSESVRQYLERLLLTKQEVSDWLEGRTYPFCKYDSELGFLHRNRRFKEGIYGSVCTYTYDESGARQTIMYAGMHADRPCRINTCRINTYGDSFTSCEQVNDGETWQEVLAAHLEEPVRNYGIGGYSVYLAYLRMRREERRNPAPYIIFNIFDDDHFRNLISWQRITNASNWKSIHPTLPYIQANPATGQFVELKNPCPTPESVYNLCDLDWVYETFKDDFVLAIRLARDRAKENRAESAGIIGQLASEYGIATQVNYSGDDLIKTADSLYARAAIFSSMRIVEKIEAFAAASGKKVLYVLSYGPPNVEKRLRGEKRSDQSFVDFLQAKQLPYVDLMEAHAADYAQFNSSIREYLGRYYIGHYGPMGNAFCAFAIREKLVAMLDPKPTPYQPNRAMDPS